MLFLSLSSQLNALHTSANEGDPDEPTETENQDVGVGTNTSDAKKQLKKNAVRCEPPAIKKQQDLDVKVSLSKQGTQNICQ